MVDDRHRVLDSEDKPIAGLLAAGSTGQGGLLLKGHGHHLAWAFASGRRAGRFAALAAAHAAHERTAAPTGETGVSAVAGSVQKVRE
jgi:fumarate reductase flavoprotein subunit